MSGLDSLIDLEFSLNRVLPSQCLLGEGLFVENGAASWVDIYNKKMFVADANALVCYDTLNMGSVIYGFSGNDIEFGTDVGLSSFNVISKKEGLLLGVCAEHDTAEYRSNDGGFCSGHKLLGFMHRQSPELNAGYIYRLSNSSWILLDDAIHIPNSFIEIEPLKILISDSLKSVVWLYELDVSGNLLNKSLWSSLSSELEPDGGCLVNDFVLIAFWGGASIGVFTRDGILKDTLVLPVLRATNCKYDEVHSQLWVTSASDGLTLEQLKEYPDSGNTFVYDVRFVQRC